MKIVVNKCYGGFGLSKEAMDMLGKDNEYEYYEDDRTSPALIEVVEKLGNKANGNFAKLTIIEIPDEATDYDISYYDGMETLTYVVNGKLYFA